MGSPPGGTKEFDPFARAGPRTLRFRAQAEPGGDATRRRFQAMYSHEDGSSRFRIGLDLARNSITFHRTRGEDYSPMLLELAGRPAGISRLPAPRTRSDSLRLDMDVIGLKLGGVQPGSARSGDWSVVQAFVPGGTDSFLFGASERLAAGEIVITRPESARAVVLTLAEVFG